jgi:hypothetical protein
MRFLQPARWFLLTPAVSLRAKGSDAVEAADRRNWRKRLVGSPSATTDRAAKPWRVGMLVIAICLVALTPASLAQSFKPNATWTNQRGSTLTIEAIAPNGSFTGNFISRAGGACQNEPYPVSGWIDGQKISFIVRWANATASCEAITSWTGYLTVRGVLTHWIIVHFNRGGSPILTSGTDVFH